MCLVNSPAVSQRAADVVFEGGVIAHVSYVNMGDVIACSATVEKQKADIEAVLR